MLVICPVWHKFKESFFPQTLNMPNLDLWREMQKTAVSHEFQHCTLHLKG